MIECVKLTKVYNAGTPREVVAARDVSFRVGRGEVFGLLGANGAGKTTTLRMVAGILKATSGDCLIGGTSVTRDGEGARMLLGYLSGETRLYERLTPTEVVGYFGEFFGMAADEVARRRARLFDLLDIARFADTPCGELSTGMKQIVSIARALIHDPPVLVFDEPTLGLDVFAARRVLDAVVRLAGEGKSILLSTHIMSHVEKVCRRAAIIHRGAVLTEGTVGEIISAGGKANFEDAFFALVEAHDAAKA